MNNGIRLRAPIEVSSNDVEQAWREHAHAEPAVARTAPHLDDAAATAAANELNRALAIDIFEVLAQGWARVPAVRNAVQLSALMEGPPAIVNLDRHNVTSTARIVLDSRVAQSALPPLTLTLEIVAGVQSATLAARAGRIELIALGKASLSARLMRGSVLVKEHTADIEGAPRDPFKRSPSAIGRQASVDIPV